MFFFQVEPCKISGGLSGQMSWSKTKGETHEETLTWSVDSQVSETISVVGGALRCEAYEEIFKFFIILV